MTLPRRHQSVLRIKGGAEIDARLLAPRMARALEVALEEAPDTDGSGVTVTSGRDSHDRGKHPKGEAIDIRTRSIRAPTLAVRRKIASQWAARVQARLGADYDVLFEQSKKTPNNDHVHIEYDPKPRRVFSAGFFARIRAAQGRQIRP